MQIDKKTLKEIELAIQLENPHLKVENINILKKDKQPIVIESLNYTNAQFYVLVGFQDSIWLYGVSKKLSGSGWWVYGYADFKTDDIEQILSFN